MIAIKEVSIVPNTVTTGQSYTISVKVFEVDWNTIKTDFNTWELIKQTLANWGSVKNYEG